MEVFLIKALQLMLSLSILVLLHEGGHFFFSKLFGVRVEKFYLSSTHGSTSLSSSQRIQILLTEWAGCHWEAIVRFRV